MIASETAALKRLDSNNLQIINEFRVKYGNYK